MTERTEWTCETCNVTRMVPVFGDGPDVDLTPCQGAMVKGDEVCQKHFCRECFTHSEAFVCQVCELASCVSHRCVIDGEVMCECCAQAVLEEIARELALSEIGMAA